LTTALEEYLGGMRVVPTGFEPGGTNPFFPTSAVGPSARVKAVMVYDSARSRVVLFGGDDGTTKYNDTWEWDGTAWAQVASTGPSVRYGHAMAYDSVRNRTVLFGGYGGSSNIVLGDTWEWNGATAAWTQVASTGPIARHSHAMTYDSARAKTVLFGGDNGGVNYFGDAWEWNGTAWVQVTTTNDAANLALPSNRAVHAMAFDVSRSRSVLFGGTNAPNSGAKLSDTWEWNGTAWLQVATTGNTPPGLSDHKMVYDAVNTKVQLVGGDISQIGNAAPYGSMWEWNGTDWAQVIAVATSARYGHAMAYDIANSKTVLFGGIGAVYLSDTWTLNRSGLGMQSDALLSLPFGEGGFRHYDCTPLAATRSLFAPDARLMRTGFAYSIHNRSTAQTLIVKTKTGATIVSLAPSNFRSLYLLDNSTVDGVWQTNTATTSTHISSITSLHREPWALRFSDVKSEPTVLRQVLNDQGYNGRKPVALVVTIDASAVLGSVLSTGNFPRGSTILILNLGTIVGAGGAGGAGANPNGSAGVGSAGGHGFDLNSTTAIKVQIINRGTIAAGGGGGGGGDDSGTVGGGGGGGGSGYATALGGAGGTSGGTKGASGLVLVGGAGGGGGTNQTTGVGGAGGASAAGATGTGTTPAAGGAAGRSYRYLFNNVTANVLAVTNYGAGIVSGTSGSYPA
jgi:hypothetical protein